MEDDVAEVELSYQLELKHWNLTMMTMNHLQAKLAQR
jgi:hypothetical protein